MIARLFSLSVNLFNSHRFIVLFFRMKRKKNKKKYFLACILDSINNFCATPPPNVFRKKIEMFFFLWFFFFFWLFLGQEFVSCPKFDSWLVPIHEIQFLTWWHNYFICSLFINQFEFIWLFIIRFKRRILVTVCWMTGPSATADCNWKRYYSFGHPESNLLPLKKNVEKIESKKKLINRITSG